MGWLVAALAHEIRLFLVALQFLTRLPIPRRLGYQSAWMQQCVRHFPLVGACVGAWAAAVTWAALWVLPPAVAVGLGMAATVWLTGGLHEDGLADTCDGLGGSAGRDRALAIMKDSRIGSYGALGLLLTLGLKAATLAALVQAGPLMALAALVWGHAASRASAVLLMRWLPYAGDAVQARAPALARRLSVAGAWAAAFWMVVISAALTIVVVLVSPRWAGAICQALACAVFAVVTVTLLCTRWFRRRLGGCTGDTLGATQQLVELAALLAWLTVVGSSTPLST